jgi:ribosome production factor 1
MDGLVDELLSIFPNSKPGTDGDIVVKVQEEYLIFQTKEQQIVFKIVEFKRRKTIMTKKESQLVLNNFNTDIGSMVAHFIMNMFPSNIESNQVVSFTVHKDFVFLRMHRFVIRETGPSMMDIGPHLTLRIWRVTEYREDGENLVMDFKKYIKNQNPL